MTEFTTESAGFEVLAALIRWPLYTGVPGKGKTFILDEIVEEPYVYRPNVNLIDNHTNAMDNRKWCAVSWAYDALWDIQTTALTQARCYERAVNAGIIFC